MLQTLSKSFQSNPEFIETTTSLLQETFQMLVAATFAILGLWYIVVGLQQPELLGGQFWVVFFTALALLRLVVFLKDRSFLAAVVCWLVGLAGLNLLAVFMFNRPEQLFFFALLPLLAVILGGWPGGVMAEGLVIILLAWLGHSAFTTYLAPFGMLIPVLGAVTGLLGWIASRTMVTLSGWSYYNFNMAREKMDEARQHRGQVYKMLKDLDLAYYRLERANAALVAAWREAENAERSKSEFVTYVSHEMRTPLNLIAGFSEMILTSPESYGGIPLPGAYREDLNKISQNAGHLLELVDDIVDLSRINVGKITLAREPVDLAGLVIETANMVGDYLKLKGLELHLNLPANLPLVPVDRLRIRQVLLNLLVNAARFHRGGVDHY